jgi:uroporphyrinogen decarboxylase
MHARHREPCGRESVCIRETSRERICKAISHIQPEQTPVNVYGFEHPQPWLEHFGAKDLSHLGEILGLDAFPDAPPIYRGPPIRPGLDIWGAAYSWTGAEGAGFSSNRGGYPLARITSIRQIESHTWPRAEDFDYSAVHPRLAAVPADRPSWIRPLYIFPADDADQNESVRTRRAEWLPILCTLFNLFGMEETLLNLSLEPAIIEAALAKIEEFVLDFCERMIEAAQVESEIFWFGDDFATQKGMLISPEHWRRYLKPVYWKIFDLAKRRGMKVWFHSCGTFRPVLPDLIDIGLDVWETAQVHLRGNEPEVLKREYGKDITFYGAINTQTTLPQGTPEQVRDEVRRRVRDLGKGGGYICSSDHSIMPDVPFENVLAMIDEAKKSHP